MGRFRKVIGVDLFAGVGGLSLGAQLAGIDVQVAVEAERTTARAYSRNFPATTILDKDARELDLIPVNKNGTSLVVFGGAPCQGFSTSNQKTRSYENPRNWLFKDFVRLAISCKPDWIVFENVKGFKSTHNGFFLDAVISMLSSHCYSVSFITLNAVNFGVPQHRERLFVIACLGKSTVNFLTQPVSRHITLREAIHDLPYLENGATHDYRKYKCPSRSDYSRLMRGTLSECSGHLVSHNSQIVVDRYKHVPQGGNWRNIPSILMNSYVDHTRCHTGIYRRLSLNEPSSVIGNFRKNMLIHPTQERGLSVREAARIQSFPDWFNFFGSIGFQQQQVADAVPPLLAKAVFDSILAS